MLDAMDWDTFWRWELFRRASDPLDARRWKRDSSRALRSLFPGTPGPRLLDATCGLGDHTVNLAEEGFRVEACDSSAIAREATRAALLAAGLDLPVFDARWERLGETHADRYDLIFHDAIHWIEDDDALDAALRGLRGALAPGGALVFFFADAREPEPGQGLASLAWDWEQLPRATLAWEHENQGRRVSLTVVNQRHADSIDQHHLYLVREAQSPPRLEALTVRRIYKWDWHGIGRALARAGFGAVRSHAFDNVKGYSYALNLAFRDP
jgi:SAM-dependent methyltransferase